MVHSTWYIVHRISISDANVQLSGVAAAQRQPALVCTDAAVRVGQQERSLVEHVGPTDLKVRKVRRLERRRRTLELLIIVFNINRRCASRQRHRAAAANQHRQPCGNSVNRRQVHHAVADAADVISLCAVADAVRQAVIMVIRRPAAAADGQGDRRRMAVCQGGDTILCCAALFIAFGLARRPHIYYRLALSIEGWQVIHRCRPAVAVAQRDLRAVRQRGSNRGGPYAVMVVHIVPCHLHRSLGVPHGLIAAVARLARCDDYLRLGRVAIAARPSAEGVALERRVDQRDGVALYGVRRGVGRSHRAAAEVVGDAIDNRSECRLHLYIGGRHRQLINVGSAIHERDCHLTVQRYCCRSGRAAARLCVDRGNGRLRRNAV